jgi:transposase InsO family protein
LQKFCSPADEGWLYLAVVIDLFSRQVVGWDFSERMTRQLGNDASLRNVNQPH